MANSFSDVILNVLLANGCLNQEQFRSTYIPTLSLSGLVWMKRDSCVLGGGDDCFAIAGKCSGVNIYSQSMHRDNIGKFPDILTLDSGIEAMECAALSQVDG